MASKGGSKAQKRFATPKVRKQRVKETKWSIRSTPGAFNKANSIPLGFLLRDLLGVGRNLKEVKIALSKGLVKVNEKTMRDYRFSVGVFDVVSVEGMEKDYRLMLDLHGRLEPREIEKKKKKSKLCRIENKKVAGKGKIQLVTNDGRSIFVEKNGFKTGDSIEIELPSQKIIKTLKMEKGAKAFIIGGKHAGEESIIQGIKPGSMESPKMVKLKAGSKEFQTTAKNVFVIGEEK